MLLWHCISLLQQKFQQKIQKAKSQRSCSVGRNNDNKKLNKAYHTICRQQELKINTYQIPFLIIDFIYCTS